MEEVFSDELGVDKDGIGLVDVGQDVGPESRSRSPRASSREAAAVLHKVLKQGWMGYRVVAKGEDSQSLGERDGAVPEASTIMVQADVVGKAAH